ncbi:hypothetical protein C475_11410 [Halosimplex carlsbadense 2-9-1]|uniref:Uncharacterized protein n=1 Tax=Halosimplex carlsbadense 2-9-1 TaxID=797114 RepID=M0CNM0_9EURY|nr:hypothetical protein [Halosimplex carlsbadense]ELZ24841.1 hypothetical protein C475_11410 [Halosimplex carlsbadense 2-9-1]
MDRLSSCYFCGAALDATLEEHPVVPGALHPGAETQKTVVLCRTCRRKLDAVLDTVVDAVDANAGDVTAGTASDGSAAAGDATAAGDAVEGDIESTLGDDEEILTPLGDDEQSPEEAAEASDMEFGDARGAEDGSESEASGESDAADEGDGGESEARKYTRSRGAGFRKEDESPAETGSLTGGAFDEDDDADDTDSGSLTGDALSDDGDGARSAGTDASTAESADDPLAGGSAGGSTDSSAGESGNDVESADESSGSSGDGSGSGESGGDHRVSMSRLENTKVMRLLENREFPVDKAEFVTVAANAYQVSQSDCEKVIDLAVEHDLLREENGQLYGGDA